MFAAVETRLKSTDFNFIMTNLTVSAVLDFLLLHGVKSKLHLRC